METKYPKHQTYEELYKRFFKRSAKELVDLGEVSKKDKVLDLCGGGGRLTRELLKVSDDVSYLDQEADMVPKDLKSLGVKIYNMSVEDFIKNPPEKFDKLFCQQAINYWLLDVDMKAFGNLLKKDGLFIFNTFANKPTKEPMIKPYIIDGINYLEVSYLIDNKVHHLQIRENYEPHYTVFDWIDEETIKTILEPYFEIEIIKEGGTHIYKCRRI